MTIENIAGAVTAFGTACFLWFFVLPVCEPFVELVAWIFFGDDDER